MNKLLLRLFDIREGEAFRAVAMFIYIFLLIASLMIVKPIRNSLFLVRFGVEKLPYVFILVALFSAIVASVYSRYAKKARLNILTISTIVISIFSLLAFWAALSLGYRAGWILYAFYIWVAIFGVITSAQFWLLANYVFNAREAKRLFGFIGSGAISGGIFGGYLTNYLAPRLRTENLIFFCIGFLLICILLVRSIWKKRHLLKQPRHEETGDNPVKLILSSRHLSYLTGIIAVGVIVANLVDFQFSAVASREILEADRLTAFFGFWLSTLSIVSLIIQMFFTGRIMKHLGVAASLFFLPLGLLLGAAALLFYPVLGTAIILKVSDGSLKHSINKAGTELLSLPIPHMIKNRTKAFIDVFIKNFSKGLGGILLLLFTSILSFSVSQISLVNIFLIGLWIYLIIKVKDEYVNSFRIAIEKRSIILEEVSINLEDAAVFNNFLKILDGRSERQIQYVLKLLRGIKTEALVPRLKKLAQHSSDKIKLLVFQAAHLYEDLDLKSDAIKSLSSENQSVQIEAIRYLLKFSDNRAATLGKYLDHKNYQIRCAALISLARECRLDQGFCQKININNVFEDIFERLTGSELDDQQKQYTKISCALAIREAEDPKLYSFLRTLLEEDDVAVLKEAVICAGSTRTEEFVSILINHLKTRHIRKYARESLAEYGEGVITELAYYLESQDIHLLIRLAIPRVLALIGTQVSTDLLLQNLGQKNLTLRNQIVKALNKLRINYSELRFEKHAVDAGILDETNKYYRFLTLLQSRKNASVLSYQDKSDKTQQQIKISAKNLLEKALEEKLDSNLERIFRLLGLKYPARDMLNAYQGVKSDRLEIRANSLELLDNILDSNLRKTLLPIVDESSGAELINKTQNLFGYKVPNTEECITFILNSQNDWLKSCTLYLAAVTGMSEYSDQANRLTDDKNPIVIETARYYLTRLG